MFKIVVSCLLISISSTIWSQDQLDADVLFENFEYALAAKAYEKHATGEKLKLKSKEKLAYCYFQTGNYAKGIPLTGELTSEKPANSHYWYWKANLEKNKGEFALAKASFEKVKQLDSVYQVDVLIESCAAIPTWQSIPRAETQLQLENDLWANNYSRLNGNTYFYYEVGKDSAENNIQISSETDAFTELFLMKPFVSNSGSKTPLFIDDQSGNYSISSLSTQTKDSVVYFSGNNPIGKNALAHIYEGKLDVNGQISNIKLVEGLGAMDDSTAQAHPAISSDGKTMVFSKMGKGTQGSDLYISQKSNGVWSTPRNLQHLNTPNDEMFPKIIGDSLLTYSSDGKVGYGSLDIYSIALSDIESGKEMNHYKAPVNGPGDDFNLEWISDSSALFVSNRIGGKGDDDVYKVTIKKIIPSAPDGDTVFTNWLAKWNNYQLYFDFDKWESELTQELSAGLLRYAETKQLNITLVGHTDAKGPSAYNQKLGMQRADWFKSQLDKEGINPERLTTSSVGETQLVNACENGVECSDEQHRLNRFVKMNITVKETPLPTKEIL